MKEESKTIGATNVTTDSTKLAEFTPAEGELWYVDDCIITHDGDGSTSSSAQARIGIYSAATNNVDEQKPDNDTNRSARLSTVDTADAGNSSSGYESIGSYITEEDTIYVSMDSTRGATCHVHVHLRRVL